VPRPSVCADGHSYLSGIFTLRSLQTSRWMPGPLSPGPSLPPGLRAHRLGLHGGGRQRLIGHRQHVRSGRVLAVRHRTARSYRLRRRTADRPGGRFLLGQRLQMLTLKPDHPAPEDLSGPLRRLPSSFGRSSSTSGSSPARLRPSAALPGGRHRRHPPPLRQLDQQRVEAPVQAVMSCLTSGMRTRGSKRRTISETQGVPPVQGKLHPRALPVGRMPNSRSPKGASGNANWPP
jgi:hypothetical protein